jgi:hypothetical protein
MEKYKLANGRKVGPPVPPRPSPTKVQQALEKTRHGFLQSTPSSTIEHGRTVIFSSTTAINSNEHIDHQLTLSNIGKCFDTEYDDSSTGSTSKTEQSGNSARPNANNCVNETRVIKVVDEPPIILHSKSPIPRPRAQALLAANREGNRQVTIDNRINALTSTEMSYQPNSYANLLMRNQNSPQRYDATSKTCGNAKNHDDELKQRLLCEMMGKSNVVETANKHVKYNASSLKRASSFDALNESLGENSTDKKVIFHEILISELSEMRRESSPRLGAAKSSPDISQNMSFFEIDDKKSLNTFVSLEDSGVEDEGKTDDCSSSGVGDSWDSCRDMENR